MNPQTNQPSYTGERHKLRVIFDGQIRGLHCCIVDYNTHPCAYIEVPKKLSQMIILSKWHSYEWFERCINVHGGVSFGYRKTLWNSLFNPDERFKSFPLCSTIIGWDYAHCGDHTQFNPCGESDYPPFIMEGKRWTTQEICMEIADVATQLVGKAR